MAPTLSREVISFLAPPSKQEEQYTHPDNSFEESDDNFGDSDNQDDEGYESSPCPLEADETLTEKRSLSASSTFDGGNKTLVRRAAWSDSGSRTTKWQDSMDTRFGPNHIERPQPWPKAKTIFAFGQKDQNGKPINERATFAKCINDFPNTLSTCEVNGVPGPEYAKSLVDNINDLATSNNRRDRELAFERVMDDTEEIAESRCNMQKLCRRTLNREINYLRRPEDEADPIFDVDWKSFATHGTLDDLRIPKKKRNGAKKAGRQFGKSLESLASLDCTIGNNTAPMFVELTHAQLRDIDGDWYISGPTLQSLNTSINDAKTADCSEWKQQKAFINEGSRAVERAYSTKTEEQQQSRYFQKSAIDQMDGRRESLAVSSKFAAGSLAGTAALATVLAN